MILKGRVQKHVPKVGVAIRLLDRGCFHITPSLAVVLGFARPMKTRYGYEGIEQDVEIEVRRVDP